MMQFSQIIFDFCIDRGGTFTDIFCQIYQISSKSFLRHLTYKLLSENPSEYEDAPREGIRRIIQYFQNNIETCMFDSDEQISFKIQQCQQQKEQQQQIEQYLVDSSQIRSIRMGTTVATNALLERKGARTALLITKGFKDLLKIGNQSRLQIFDLQMKKVEQLYEKVVEIDERVRLINEDQLVLDKNNKVEQIEGQQIEIIKEVNIEESEREIRQLKEEGIESIAIVLINSYIYNKHETIIKEISSKIGFKNISTSNEIIKTIKIVNRGWTTMVDGYLNPHIMSYTQKFQQGFKNDSNTQIFFMQSDGGMTGIKEFRGSRSILSGPAGGVVGLINVGLQYLDTDQDNLLGFDMGGTSTDVSRYNGQGPLDHKFDSELCGIQIATPHIDIETVAAGGGSRLFFNQGVFQVGPESSSAFPGPVCYGNKGYLSVTDANLLLGKIQASYFPRIFGPTHDQPLDYVSTQEAFNNLQQQINNYLKLNKLPTKSIYQIAQGFIDVANENMCRAIRNMTQGKGVDPKKHLLITFGGAAGQHCTKISDILGIKKIFIHEFSGILSAVGLSIADIVEDCTYSMKELRLDSPNLITLIDNKLQQLQEQNIIKLNQYSLQYPISHEHFLALKYQGTDTILQVQFDQDQKKTQANFETAYQAQFGFNLQNRSIMITSIRVRSCIKNNQMPKNKFDPLICQANNQICDSKQLIYIENKETKELEQQEVEIYLINKLKNNTFIQGPVLIIQHTSTIVVEQGWLAYKVQDGILLIKQQQNELFNKIEEEEVNSDPIQLAIFGNRFMSIAEEMGKALQRTSVSVNIKERLDFSCALFDSNGNLVANAPHLPVHLGSMSSAVKYQIQKLGHEWKEGQSILSNHPAAGGSHLPDLTVITPVYHQKQVIFYVASRGHHSDIGGISPGSMPAFSKSIHEEGIAVKTFILCQDNTFQEQQLITLLKGDKDIIGSRNIADNISDLKAQLSANYRGVQLVQCLINEQGLNRVLKYMNYIQQLAQQQVQSMLCQLSIENNMQPIDSIQETDQMDNGSTISLLLTIDRVNKKAIFDFTQSSPQIMGNTNCPKSVVYSAILYCLRCLIKSEIPLNHGCLIPIEVKIKENSILDPSDQMGIVGGNVLTSQTITDLILRCFKRVANSYGCMNNFTFGNDRFGYYETICGGSGAGEGFEGTDAVQAHMTNTRITDVEVLESRYPVFINQFTIRANSGGLGKYKGGNGVIRQFTFLQDNIQVSLLTERRVHQPKGLNGGCNAQSGLNLLITSQGSLINIGGKQSFTVNKNDSVLIHTPGGAGYGSIKS